MMFLALLEYKFSSPLKSSVASVVLTLSASLNALAPSVPNSLSVSLPSLPLSFSLHICCERIRITSSDVSVALAFRASQSARVPSAPISLSAFENVFEVHSFSPPCFTFLMLTFELQRSKRCVDLERLAQCASSFVTDPVDCIGRC